MTIPPISIDTLISSRSFLRRLAAGVLLVNLFVFTLVGLSLRQGYHQYQERAEISTHNLALALESEIKGTIETDNVALSAVMDEYQKQRTAGLGDGRTLNAYIERVRLRLPEIDALRITDAEGMLVYGSGVAPGAKTSLADRPHFIRLRDDPKAKLAISQPQISRINQKWVIVLARRINQPDGAFGGMVFAAIALEHLSKTFSSLNVGPHGIVTLRNTDMSIVARHPEPNGVGSVIGQSAAPAPLRALVRAGLKAGTYQALSTVDGLERTFSYRQVASHPLLIIVGLATDDYLAEWRNNVVNLLALVAFFALFTLLAARLIYLTWKRQMNAVEALAVQEAKFRTVADFTFDWEYWQGPNQEILYMTPSCERVAGYTQEEFVADPGLLLRIIHPDDLHAMDQHLHDIGYQDGALVDFRVVRRDGEIRWITHHCRAITGQSGESAGRRVSNRDITERKQAENALRQERDQSQRHLDTTLALMVELDGDGKITMINRAAQNLLGYAGNELLGRNWFDTCLPQAEGMDEVFPVYRRIMTGDIQSAQEFENSILCRDGRQRVIAWCNSYLTDAAGQIVGTFSSGVDITERKQAEKKLHLAASVFTHAREGIMITAADGMIIDVNDAFTRITSYSHNEVLGRNPRILNSGRQKKEFYSTMWRDLTKNGHWYGEIWNQRKNGEMYAVMQTISAVRDARGDTLQYVALFSDITPIKEHEQHLEHIAHYDALTSLPNRILLADRLHQSMPQAQRRGQRLAVVYLDLDGFKAVNDRHGHEAGDQLLMTVATRMKQALREGDTLARMGGDEFVAVLVDLADSEASVPMLTRLLAAAAEPVQVDGCVLQVSASLGVTFYPQAEDMDADQLLRQADQAMYQAKLAGKDRYYIFDAEHDRSIRGHHESLERIRRALAEREFVLYYQPKVNMRTGTVIGTEALIRWQHPEKGLLPPSVFLPVIEDHPLAVEIGEWVIATALTQMALWQAAGLDVPVSVNVGARQLQQPDFVERLRGILAAHPGILPCDLELEVLETSALEDLGRVSQVIEACREIGVTFALDDFGTGYSSLTYLKRLPVTLLKIDQSFVHGMLDDPDDLAILEGVIGLATAFRRQAIAEGVETVEHGAMLLQLGCELAQGYGIARPMPAHELPGWSAVWRPDLAWVDLPAVSRDDLPVLYASVEHRAWIIAMENHLKGEREAPPPMDCHQCRFGSWLDAEGLARHGAQPAFQAIQPLHREVHALAAELCELRATGRNPEALARLGELHGLRDALLEQLKALAQKNRQ